MINGINARNFGHSPQQHKLIKTDTCIKKYYFTSKKQKTKNKTAAAEKKKRRKKENAKNPTPNAEKGTMRNVLKAEPA